MKKKLKAMIEKTFFAFHHKKRYRVGLSLKIGLATVSPCKISRGEEKKEKSFQGAESGFSLDNKLRPLTIFKQGNLQVLFQLPKGSSATRDTRGFLANFRCSGAFYLDPHLLF